MLSKDQCIDAIKAIDFGDIDGYGDPNLEKYFLDDNYWGKIIKDSKFFIVDRKGTGKSSIYRMIADEAYRNSDIIMNEDFGSFPFEKLLELEDKDFSKPNQYQSIWKNLILNIFATMISKHPRTDNIHESMIRQYVDTCLGNVIELHKELVNSTVKTSYGLNFKGLSAGSEHQAGITIGSGTNNVSRINSELYKLIVDYFISFDGDCSFIIQFDRLDDNYNQYQDIEQYFNAIISLFKVAYQINQDFRYKKIKNAKIIIYLRSDIYRELSKRDAESARWDDFKMDINWSIINKRDWDSPKLLHMIDKRIAVSVSHLGKDACFRSIFNKEYLNIVSSKGYKLDGFKYMIERTMQRPRDLVQFCKCMQKEVIKTNKLDNWTVNDAEKEFTDWLLNKEITNEINPILKNVEPYFELLKLIGSKPFSLSDFRDRCRSIKELSMEYEKLAFYLYDVGIIQNVETTPEGYREYRSMVRNHGKLDRNMKMIIHTGVWRGLTQ